MHRQAEGLNPSRTELGVAIVRSAVFTGCCWMTGAVLRLARSTALRDATTLGTGALLSQAILLFAAPAFLRLYQPADFGLYSFAYGAIALVATLGTWKIERLIVVVPARATAIRLLVALVSIGAVVAALLLVLTLLIQTAAGVFSTEARKGLALLCPAPLSMFILLASTGMRFYSIRVRRFKAVAAAQISRTVVFATGTVATGLLWRGLGGNGALIMLSWQIAADACALFVQFYANRQAVKLLLLRPRLRRSLTVLMRHRNTLGVLALSQIINSVNQQIPISTVALAFGAVPAGWYSLAIQFVYAPCNIVTLAVSDVANQRLARRHAERRPFSNLVLRTTFGMAAAGAVPFTLVALLGPMLLPVVLGPQWLGASQSVSILVVASYFWFVAAPAENVALIVEARRYILLWYTLRMGCLVGLGAAALFGLISYSVWLVLIVAGDAALYLLTMVSAVAFARVAESRWRRDYVPDSPQRLSQSFAIVDIPCRDSRL
jgi:O-antigen/teichoic acid export membrane protein